MRSATRRNTIKLGSLSMFFPACNEAGNVEELVRQAIRVAPRVARKWEVIIIDNGSQDSTGLIVKRLCGKYKQLRLVHQDNKGYGGAIKRGFSEARYEWIFLSDSDLQFDLEEIEKLVEESRRFRLVIGYRKRRAEGWKREVWAQALRIWNHLWLEFPLEIKDIDCAFKLMHREVLEAVMPLYSDGAMVSTEFLLKADRIGYPIKQVGVKHFRRRIGKPSGDNVEVILGAIKDTFVLKRIIGQPKWRKRNR